MLHPVPQGIGHLEQPALGGMHLAHARGVQRQRTRVRIRAHQPAGTQQDTAKVAGDHHGAVHHTPRLHDLDDGHAGGAGGLAVVAVTHDTRVPADDVGVAVVRGVAVLLADTREEPERLLRAAHRRRVPDEAAFVDNHFIAGLAQHGFIALQAHLRIRRQ